MSLKFDLKYFTGTGNSLKILNTLKAVFNENGHQVEISAINANQPISYDANIIGFCFPVYAFGIPRVCRDYLKKLEQFKENKKAFVIITAGAADESGFSVGECVKILKKKNCSVISTSVIEMPINWTVSMNPPSKEEALQIISKAVEQTKNIANDILAGKNNYHQFNIPKRYGRFGLYREYFLFRYLGIKNLWRLFKTYETCNGCGLCAKACPTGSIKMINNKPVWNSSCEQCMRCVNYCPREAIYQSYGGNTKGRNRYLEPDFKPLLNNQEKAKVPVNSFL